MSLPDENEPDNSDRGASRLEFITIAEAQRLAGGESRSSIYRALAAGELVAVKRGRRTLILRESANRRLEALPKAKFRSTNGPLKHAANEP